MTERSIGVPAWHIAPNLRDFLDGTRLWTGQLYSLPMSWRYAFITAWYPFIIHGECAADSMLNQPRLAAARIKYQIRCLQLEA